MASDSAPPELSSICPKIAPSPTTVATNPNVPAMPSCIDMVMALRGIPVAIPTNIETSSRAMKALILSFSTMYRSNSTAEITMIRIVNVDIVYKMLN